MAEHQSAAMEKPEKVYQGVRVKWTVKDMLKFYREKAASGTKLKTAYLEMKELYAPSVPGVLLDPLPTPTPADTPSRAGAAAASPVPESIPLPPCAFGSAHPPFADALVSSFDPRAADFCGTPPCSPPPWSHGLSSDVDFYGHAAMRERQVPCPPLDPLTLCASSDLHSFSPQDSFSSSSSSSSCFDSPPRMGPCYHPADFYQYPHFEPPQDCEAAYWQQESQPAPEYTTYYPPTDYPYICPPEDPYWRRD